MKKRKTEQKLLLLLILALSAIAIVTAIHVVCCNYRPYCTMF